MGCPPHTHTHRDSPRRPWRTAALSGGEPAGTARLIDLLASAPAPDELQVCGGTAPSEENPQAPDQLSVLGMRQDVLVHRCWSSPCVLT